MDGRGIGCTINSASSTGIEVVRAKRSNKADGSPGKKARAIVEKNKAESPKPETTSPVVVACC